MYPLCNIMAFCNSVTWAEIKWVKQLIMHGATMSRISMVTTGISRGSSQLQNPPLQEKIPKWDWSQSGGAPAQSLRSWMIYMIFLRTEKLSSTLIEALTPTQKVSFRMAQVSPCYAFKRSVACLFWNTTLAKLSIDFC